MIYNFGAGSVRVQRKRARGRDAGLSARQILTGPLILGPLVFSVVFVFWQTTVMFS